MSGYRLLHGFVLPPFLKKITTVTGLEHLPPTGGFMLAPNHTDWLDGFYLIAVIDHHRHVPVKFLTASNNYWWTGIAVQVPYQKEHIVQKAVKELEDGDIVCNFPEGSRNFSATLLPGKTGTVRMAATSGVPVIPVGLRLQPGRTMMDSIRSLRSADNPVALNFGPPLYFTIPPGGITKEWLEAETARLMAAIAPLAGKAV